jgi:hypothetical protein
MDNLDDQNDEIIELIAKATRQTRDAERERELEDKDETTPVSLDSLTDSELVDLLCRRAGVDDRRIVTKLSSNGWEKWRIEAALLDAGWDAGRIAAAGI